MPSQSAFPSAATGWTNPSNVGATDGVYASVVVAAAGSSGLLYGDGFNGGAGGWTIPSGATIVGVQLAIVRHCGAGGIKDLTVRLLKGGSPTGSNYAATATAWPTTDGSAIYGGSSDLWGTTLTPSDVNAGNFGLVLAVTAPGSGDTAYVDSFELTIYYTAFSSSGAILLCQMRTAPPRPRAHSRRRWPQRLRSA